MRMYEHLSRKLEVHKQGFRARVRGKNLGAALSTLLAFQPAHLKCNTLRAAPELRLAWPNSDRVSRVVSNNELREDCLIGCWII